MNTDKGIVFISLLLSLTTQICHSFLLDGVTQQNTSFRLSFTPSRVTRGLTEHVKLICDHDGVTTPQFSEISRIRIMRQTSTGWSLFFEKTLAYTPTNVPYSSQFRANATIARNITGTYAKIEWEVATQDTFGTFRCDIIGIDSNLAPVSESTREVLLAETAVTTDELLTMLIETRAQLAALSSNTNSRLNSQDSKIERVSEDALSKDDVAAWPAGDYALVQPKVGCPVDLTFMGGDSSYFVLHTESSSETKNENAYSEALPMSTTTILNGKENMYTLRFCEAKRSFETKYWPSGSYCINKIPGKSCPRSLDEGNIYLDAEDNNTTTDLRGNVVAEYGDRAKLEFCCMDRDMYSGYEMRLPTDTPFLLYRKGGSCQKVRGMRFSEEYLLIDTEDTNNGDTVGGSFPDINQTNTQGKAIVIFLCYYTKI